MISVGWWRAWRGVAVASAVCGGVGLAQSVYTVRPVDPHAVYLDAKEFGARGDGVADDAAALQNAVDRVQETTRHGVVFLPAGRYRLSRTIHVWAGIRLIGFGAKRPVLVLGRNTPGFQEGADRYMLWFTDERTPPGLPVADASEFTFYSGVRNVDFELEEGNPAAVAVRFNVAQHGFVTHARFHLGGARAAMEAVGNQASNIEVEGGQFGIVTGKTSPAWQFLLMDSAFRGQQVAAIRTAEAGFTLVRDRFADVPVAIQIPAGEVEQLYGRDLQMRNVSKAVLQVGDVLNVRSEITLENTGCAHVARFAEGTEEREQPGQRWLNSAYYVEEHFTAGLEMGADGREKGIAVQHRERKMARERAAVATDVPALPPMRAWVNVRELGAKGDGGTDDTAALQHAVNTHAALYFPSGIYRLSGTLRLRADTTLVGFSPITTQLVLADGDAKFQGAGAAMPLLSAPAGGATRVTGIGIATGNANPRAAGVEWQAGRHSLLEDVDFIRGRSAYVRALAPAETPPSPAANGKRTPMQLDAQHASLWVHDGGGGVFRGIWSHAGTATAGLLVERTATPGVVYQFSCEHHMSREVRMDHVSGWTFYDLQTEEEKPEGADAVAVELEGTHKVLLANTYMYRVSRNVMPKKNAVEARDSAGVVFDNVKVFSQTRLAFDNSVREMGSGVEVRAHDFRHFALEAGAKRGGPLPVPAVFAPGAALRQVATGFSNASGLCADGEGNVYFTDAAMHLIYRYPAAGDGGATVLAKTPELSPMAAAFVAPGTLLVINNEKSVSAVDAKSGAVTAVEERLLPQPGTVLLLPVGLHNELVQLRWMVERRGYKYRVGSNTAKRSALVAEHRGYFYAPGSTTAVFAGGTWRPNLQASQLAGFAPGEEHYLTSEDDGRTYVAKRGEGETLSTRPFAERGGTAVVSDATGNVYVAGSQVFVFDRTGREIGSLEVPERPTSLCWGGADGKTLFVAARSSLYAIGVAAAGK